MTEDLIETPMPVAPGDVTGTEKSASSSAPAPAAVRRPRPRRPSELARTTTARGNPKGRRCTAVTLAGGPCPAPPLSGHEQCRMHTAKTNPALAEVVALEARLAGLRQGLKKAQVAQVVSADFTSPEGVRVLLQKTADDVRSGALAPSQANSVAQLANVALRLAELSLESRLVELELRLKRAKADAAEAPLPSVVPRVVSP